MIYILARVQRNGFCLRCTAHYEIENFGWQEMALEQQFQILLTSEGFGNLLAKPIVQQKLRTGGVLVLA